MYNPIKNMTVKEWFLWMTSLVAVTASNILSRETDVLTLAAAGVGVTSLIFAAKGNVWAQILMIIFSIMYGIISWRFRYWGEMITYLGMTMPMAIWSAITWMRNPSESGEEVAIQKLGARHIAVVSGMALAITVVFYFILRMFDTPNIIFSTISVTTSFVAAAFTMLRTSYYALWYAFNDIVLIALWALASMENPAYIAVVVNFAIFFINDIYGFVSWKRREEPRRKVC